MTPTLFKLPVLAALAAITLSAQAADARAAEKEIVEYRLEDWYTVEFEDKDKAKTHYDTVKKLGCEAKQEDHDGHIDVTYRCTKWKKMSLKTHKDAHKWLDWLEASGFEAKHEH